MLSSNLNGVESFSRLFSMSERSNLYLCYPRWESYHNVLDAFWEFLQCGGTKYN